MKSRDQHLRDASDFGRLLTELRQLGCWPAVAWRGRFWRAHINAAGNYWADGATPDEALEKAYSLWLMAGRPLDGYAQPEEYVGA